MKNRTQPYGYLIENGNVVTHRQEAEIVRFIFRAYCNDSSLASISQKLNQDQVEYQPGVIG